jgi:uncharacterized protein (DUF1330 family)
MTSDVIDRARLRGYSARSEVMEIEMTAYAVGCLRDVTMGPDIVRYLEGIDATLAPFGGAFLIHGGRPEVLEGSMRDDLIVIGFPTMDAARAWYSSDAYRAIIRYRTENAAGDVFLIEGVEADHKATDILG